MLFQGWEAWYTALVIVLMIVALAREFVRPDLVLLGSLGLLLLAGVVTPEQAFGGFSNEAVITIAALYVVAAGVERTEGLAFLDRVLFTRGKAGPTRFLARLMFPTALISGFVNNTPLVAMLIPRVQAWARREDVPASKVMIPLSYATVLGGMITLLGTSTNLVVAGLLGNLTGIRPGLFTITVAGLPAALAGITYFALLGHRLLPSRRPLPNGNGKAGKDYFFELRVAPASMLAGKTVEEADLRALNDAFLTHIVRGERVVGPISPQEVLQPGDVLAFSGSTTVLDRLLEREGLERTVRPPHSNGHARLPQFEAVVAPNSSLINRTLRQVEFRERFQGVVVAIQRSNERFTSALGSVPIEAGDLLLVEARPSFYDRWRNSRDEFYLVAPVREGSPAKRRHKAPVALAIFGAMVLLSAFNVVPLITGSFAAALAMILTRCIRFSETRKVVDVPILIMIATALGIGEAIKASGLAEAVAGSIVEGAGVLGPLGVLLTLYMATNVMTELLTNSAAAALLVPVAVSAAAKVGADPMPFAIAVAVAASAGFATPFGYQTNLMVMSAGGYRFVDYVKAGLPLNFIVMAVAVAAIWLYWL